MSKIDLSANATEPQEQTEAKQPAPGEQLPARTRGIRDYIPTFKESRLPRVNVVQKSSDAVRQFPVGTVLYRKTVPLYIPRDDNQDGTAPGEGVILGLMDPHRWAEKKINEIGGELVTSVQQAKALGGTVDYREWKASDFKIRYFEPMPEFIILFKQPKHLPKASPFFPFVIDEERYGLGIWAMRGAAYNNCVSPQIFADRNLGPTREYGYPSCLYQFTTWFKSWGGKKDAMLPSFVAVGPTTESFQKFAKELIEGSHKVEESGPAEE